MSSVCRIAENCPRFVREACSYHVRGMSGIGALGENEGAGTMPEQSAIANDPATVGTLSAIASSAVTLAGKLLFDRFTSSDKREQRLMDERKAIEDRFHDSAVKFTEHIVRNTEATNALNRTFCEQAQRYQDAMQGLTRQIERMADQFSKVLSEKP